MKKTTCIPYLLLLVFLLAANHVPKSQQPSPEPAWLNTYHKAEALYTSADATDKTDLIALAYYNEVIEVLSKQEKSSEILVDAYLKAGILLMMQNQKQSSLKYLKTAISVKGKHPNLADTLLFKPYLYSGSIYYEENNLDSAYWFYRQAENILERFPMVDESQRLYNKLGALYYETGDYRKSIPYFSKALSTITNRNPGDLYLIVNYKNNIASSLHKLGYIDSAIAVYKELLPIGINTNQLLHNIGAALLDEEKYGEAFYYLKQADYETPARYNHLARTCLGLQKQNDAEKYAQQALDLLAKKKSGAHDLDYANSLLILGDIAMKKNRTLDAVRYYQRSILQLKLDFTDTSIYSNPTSFRTLSNSFALFNVLVAKAKAFKHIGGDDDLHAFHAYESALKLSKQLQLMYSSDEAKLFLSEKVTPACRDAIDLGINLSYKKKDTSFITKIFMFCEGNKASVLQAGLNRLQLDSISSLPSSLLRESKNIKALISKLNLQISITDDSLMIKSISKKIIDLEIQLAANQEKLEDYPAYRQLIFSTHETGTNSIRENIIKSDEAILSYYYTSTQLLCFYMTKEAGGLVNTVLNIDLSKNINSYRRELDAGEAGDKHLVDSLSFLLFDQLVQPVFQAIKYKKRIVIIPYNEISYVPFEALKDHVTKEYFLNMFAVSYQYSANFLTPYKTPNPNNYRILAFAPFTGNKENASGLQVLPASKAEVEHLNGTILYDADATKARFIQLSHDFPIIHLATHARANDIDPLQSYIEFYADSSQGDTIRRLYEQEIYHMDMQSVKLVVLSACETGAGQLVNGEGIMSLSRAFSYAGCPAVITSLWRAEDQATSFISRRLHYYLSEGKEIDAALQLAKQDLLKSDEISARLKSPAFWAHLVLIGDYHAVHSSSISKHWFWILGIGLLALLILFFLYNKKRRK